MINLLAKNDQLMDTLKMQQAQIEASSQKNMELEKDMTNIKSEIQSTNQLFQNIAENPALLASLKEMIELAQKIENMPDLKKHF